MSKTVDFDQWVNDNNPPIEKNFGKGFWDYVEYVRRLAYLTNACEISVIGRSSIRTPPPCEQMTLPVVRLSYDDVVIDIAYDFSRDYFSMPLLIGGAVLDHVSPIKSETIVAEFMTRSNALIADHPMLQIIDSEETDILAIKASVEDHFEKILDVHCNQSPLRKLETDERTFRITCCGEEDLYVLLKCGLMKGQNP